MADELQDVIAIVVLSPSDYEFRVRYWDDFFPEREALDLIEQFCDSASKLATAKNMANERIFFHLIGGGQSGRETLKSTTISTLMLLIFKKLGQFCHLKAQYWESNLQRSTTSLRSQALTTETIPLLLHSTPDLLIDFIGRADVIGKLPRTV
ncbi:hypothetical protein AFGD_008301 [Aspergillus flavus]|nr:hypothetical protein AFGD_008301 [Aspergillus flavus]